ncbi:TBC1 domain family member 16-like [Stylophora pistillata]|uniref:TBC1 domain family member 16 n=1 Tax=Stylophora pistillata TaxID=50429 RepID=A0A2B4RJ94_STYPI|nr:TBC1 domain family member 16-like [Stylophora pistillata]PFX16883.1 TBC1 domain family member 16 [Stylophora pistillata]
MLSHLIKFAVEGSAVFDSLSPNSFYVDGEDDPSESEEVLFCKNNVCVHSSSLDDSHSPGYFTLKSITHRSGLVRLLVTWTPNTYFCDEQLKIGDRQLHDRETEKLQLSKLSRSTEKFSVDLNEMKSVRLFNIQEDDTRGQLVIGNYENHYKVFHFHHGGLDRITQVLQLWFAEDVNPLDEGDLRKKSFTVVSKRNLTKHFHPEEGRFDPMTVLTWKKLFDDRGRMEDVVNFRKATFFGGLSPEVRREAWKFLLHYFPFGSSIQQRQDLQKDREREYLNIQVSRQERNQDEKYKFWKAVECIVDKDVIRTDRSHPYFAGNDNPNVIIMRNILLNYATHNPRVGYNQGMSDLLATVLAVVQDEVDAFWCFVGLMERSVFVTSPKDDIMDSQLCYLRELLRLLLPRFYAHCLLQDDAMDMLFCHRWLLLSFKREFFNEEVLKMWEACWSHYQTKYFHIFLCVAVVQEYGGPVVDQNMSADDMLQFFTDLSMKMDGSRVLRMARQSLLKFRQLPGIPCSLRRLLSGPGIWDSAPLPEIECSCLNSCVYLHEESKLCK